eukprot:TRINITY_DN37337_c0_g1_i1.p1 TRINITY_DN37337_c0_g1~~TRINITY_DN37337_c0_g1_i1.p1  ORF type:complete len:224 (-),score=34.44 TRINITY_DN37337_c0_g1_i1:303-974(-)
MHAQVAELWDQLASHPSEGEPSVTIADFGAALHEYHPCISLPGLMRSVERCMAEGECQHLTSSTPLSRLSHATLLKWFERALQDAEPETVRRGMPQLIAAAAELAAGTDICRRRARESCAIQMCVASSRQGSETVWYLVDASWLRAWRTFVNSSAADNSPPPGPISNHRLICSKTSQPVKGLKVKSHYRGLSQAAWRVLMKAYGGGPAIVRPNLNLYSKSISS